MVSVIYSLWLIYRTFQGPAFKVWNVPDLGIREMAVFAAMIIIIVWLGLYPQPVLNTTQPSIDSMQKLTGVSDVYNSKNVWVK